MEANCVLARDRISNLPLDVMEHILMCLPIRDAVKTTILSSKWKNKWTTIPQLVFDDTCVPSSPSGAAVCRSSFVSFVNQVLLLHQGPIRKFGLSSSYLEDSNEIDEWMEYLSWRDIKEFCFIREDYLNWISVPSSLFSFQYLTHLELFGCEIFPPDTFRCFSHLKCLVFETSYYENCVLQSLLDKCPHLERFILTYNGYSSLNICAPNLKYLYVGGFFEGLCLEYTPLLSTININLHVDDETIDYHAQTTTCNMIKVIGGTPLLESFAAQSHFVKYLSKNMPKSLPVKYNRLKELELYAVDFQDVNQISVAICLIANSPNLEEFTCSSFSTGESCIEFDLNYWKTQHSLDCFKRLQFVTLEDISGLPNELEFIRLLFVKSSMLKTMCIMPSKRVIDQGWDVLTEMLLWLGCFNVTSSMSINSEGNRIYPRIEIIYREGVSSIACISNEESLMRSENRPDEESS